MSNLEENPGVGSPESEQGTEAPEAKVGFAETAAELDAVDGKEEKQAEGVEAYAEEVGIGDKEIQSEKQTLKEKIKKSKVVRAGVLALGIAAGSPELAAAQARGVDAAAEVPIQPQRIEQAVDAVTQENTSEKSETAKLITAAEAQKSLDAALNEQKGMPFDTKEYLREVVDGAPDDKRQMIIDAVTGEYQPIEDQRILDAAREEDPTLLANQQQIIDLQRSGEMAPRNTIVPEDLSELGNEPQYYGGEPDNSPYSLFLKKATPLQIEMWGNYMKDKDRYMEDVKSWRQKNKQGWQNVYPERQQWIDVEEKEE